MKKITAAVLSLLFICLSFSACSIGGDRVIEINGTRLDKEIYTYYLDRALAGDAEYTAEEAKAEAAADCTEYVAINTKFAEMQMSLPDDVKGQVSAEVNNTWQIYGKYYEKIGVSKQTITKIFESEAYRSAIFLGIYDAGGTNPVAEDEIKKYWNENYIVFKAISGYLTDVNENGETVPMKNAERIKLTAEFKHLTERINAGEGVDAVYASYIQQEGAAVETSVIGRTSSVYPEGFFEAVSKTEAGKAETVVLGDYIFSVQRMAGDSDGGIYYQMHRESCLVALRQGEFGETVKGWRAAYTAEVNERAAERCYKEIAANSSKFNSVPGESESL